MKQIYLFEGVGFLEQNSLIGDLDNLNVLSSRFRLADQLLDNKKKELASADMVIVRGYWSAHAEERLMAKILAEKWKDALDVVLRDVTNKKRKLVAIGRGANVLMEHSFFSSHKKTALEWKRMNFGESPWVDCTVKVDDVDLLSRALLMEEAQPTNMQEAYPDLKPWLVSNGSNIGWNLNNQVYFSYMDPLALVNRSQLEDFGYADLSAISNRNQILMEMLR